MKRNRLPRQTLLLHRPFHHEVNTPAPTPVCWCCKRISENRDNQNPLAHGMLVKPHCLSDADPFDKLLNNLDETDNLFSDPKVITAIQLHLVAIEDNARLEFNPQMTMLLCNQRPSLPKIWQLDRFPKAESTPCLDCRPLADKPPK